MLETAAARRHDHHFNPLPGLKYLLLSLGLGCAILTVTVATGGAAAQEDPYLKCVDVKKGKKRLQCYDTVLKELHPEMFQKIEEARKAEQREAFGSPRSPARSKDAKELQQVDVVIVEFAKNPYGRWLLVTEDGQVWKQVDDFRLKLKGKQIKGRIKRGLAGAYFFLPEGKKYGIKIKRIR